jgi:hypothetical protein
MGERAAAGRPGKAEAPGAGIPQGPGIPSRKGLGRAMVDQAFSASALSQ